MCHRVQHLNINRTILSGFSVADNCLMVLYEISHHISVIVHLPNIIYLHAWPVRAFYTSSDRISMIYIRGSLLGDIAVMKRGVGGELSFTPIDKGSNYCKLIYIYILDLECFSLAKRKYLNNFEYSLL